MTGQLSLSRCYIGLVFGDSHLVTLDGHSYTFNGRGEFILITSDDGSFTLQGRMTEIAAQEEESSFQLESSGNGATVLTAVVASEPGADTVQFEVVGGDLKLRVNGRVHQVLSDEMQFRNVAISSRAPNTLAATFTTGARIEVRSTNSLLSLLAVSLPERYAQKRSTKGLLGPYNKDSSDDFLPRYSEISLPHNSSLHDNIHWKFGITCEEICIVYPLPPEGIYIIYIIAAFSDTSEKNPSNRGHLSVRDTQFYPVLIHHIIITSEHFQCPLRIFKGFTVLHIATKQRRILKQEVVLWCNG